MRGRGRELEGYTSMCIWYGQYMNTYMSIRKQSYEVLETVFFCQ